MLADPAIELVIVNTPNYTHYEYAKKALLADKHVVVEKPFTATIAEAKELVALASEKKKMLSVFQNRRFDSDYQTVRKVVKEQLLGEIVEAEFHYDRYNAALSAKAHKETAGLGTGVLYDLGSHLIDQALYLFGMPDAVFADMQALRPGSQVNDYMEVLLYYKRLRVRLKSGYLVREPVPSYIIHGVSGSFLKSRADVQEVLLIAGEKPDPASWGIEPESERGLLHTEKDGKIIRERIPTERGNYGEYYQRIYEALRESKDPPVTGAEAINVMQIIEAANESSKLRKVVEL
jgi:scyllo-inositol 2-dehydrogenase (NADP+)